MDFKGFHERFGSYGVNILIFALFAIHISEVLTNTLAVSVSEWKTYGSPTSNPFVNLGFWLIFLLSFVIFAAVAAISLSSSLNIPDAIFEAITDNKGGIPEHISDWLKCAVYILVYLACQSMFMMTALMFNNVITGTEGLYLPFNIRHNTVTGVDVATDAQLKLTAISVNCVYLTIFLETVISFGVLKVKFAEKREDEARKKKLEEKRLADEQAKKAEEAKKAKEEEAKKEQPKKEETPVKKEETPKKNEIVLAKTNNATSKDADFLGKN